MYGSVPAAQSKYHQTAAEGYSAAVFVCRGGKLPLAVFVMLCYNKLNYTENTMEHSDVLSDGDFLNLGCD